MCAYDHIVYMFNCSVIYTIFYESGVPVYEVSMKCKQLKSQYTTCGVYVVSSNRTFLIMAPKYNGGHIKSAQITRSKC